jgi:hypothetical protein
VNLIYQVAVGETPPFYDLCITSVAKYCARYRIEHVVQREPRLKIRPRQSCRSANALRLGYLPIFEKAMALNYLDGARSVLILDADVYVRPSAPNIFEEQTGSDFAAVLEREMPLTNEYAHKVCKYSYGQYVDLDDVDWQWSEKGAAFFNMGVMLLGPRFGTYLHGQTPREFLERPEFERFVNGQGHWRWSTDQTLWNYWLKKTGLSVRSMDWRFNALYNAVRSVADAYFVHFFLAAKLPQGGLEIPAIIERL